MDDGTIVVTGAATGIGRRAAVELARRGHRVVVVTRSDDRTAAVLAEAAATRRDARAVGVAADLADLRQVRDAVERIAELGPVQAVINNAAILAVARRRSTVTPDGIEEICAVNHVAPFVLTIGLLDHLIDDGRVINAGSKGLTVMPWLRLDPDNLDGLVAGRRWSSARAYYLSKLAQLAFTAELCRRGVTATALRIPSVRLDDERLRTYPRLLQLAYRPKMALATDPESVARRYVELAVGASPPCGHVDERGRAIGWPNGSGAANLGAQVWWHTSALAGGTYPLDRD
ncbi:hypothetical protein BH23ACT10_BH23ACT10_02680 [soil metagenome]